MDNAELHYSRADLRGKEGGPIAHLGPLGWTCIGPPEARQLTGARTHVSRTLFTREPFAAVDGVCCDIDQTLKRLWEVENCGTERCDNMIFTKEESATLRKLESSVSYTGERYKVGVPRKDNRPKLPDNCHTALTRLSYTENKLKKDPVVGAEYAQTIQAYVEEARLAEGPTG